ncbi:MAG: SDR family NAD(P)-dependent oxidoreductase [Chitinophagales bacterium]|nr:SDR family NAD(P)-dependent oxidoreductase [Chitinophagales bacterium]MDW8393226.1 SDR family NAD(P)-dependent oxidoreductase [Chitinophagales bacterium]
MKTVLVTGATSGFGQAIAQRFAAGGCRLIICGRRMERLIALQASMQQRWSTPVLSLCFDVRNREATEQSLQQVPHFAPALDVLVNNAGLAAGLDPIDSGSVDDWDQMVDTNLKGLLYVTRQLLPLLKQSSAPYVFNIGSTAGKYIYEKGNVYCATKAAVAALSEAMRIDLLRYGFRVTNLQPGLAETEFSLVRFKGDSQRARAVYEGLQPLRAEDIAELVWYCFNLPPHVCINEMTVTPTAQANPFYILRKGT